MQQVMQQLDEYFGITEKGSSVRTEVMAGFTTFLTMAYILIVNPSMLALAGLPFDDVLFATAMAAFVGCVVMGLWANLPFALAPGMGLNAYFTFAVVGAMGIAWQVALAAVLVEGVIFLIISLPQVGLRTQMINSIPKDLKIATGAGIGMFLALIGFREMGWVVNHPVTLVGLADMGALSYDSGALLGMIAVLAISVMMVKRIPGAIIIGILGISIIGWAVGADDPYNAYGSADHWDVNADDPYTPGCTDNCTQTQMTAGWGSDVAEWPTSIFGFVGMPEKSLGAAVNALGDIGGKDVSVSSFLLVMIAFLFVDIFDTAGTLYSVGRQAGYVDENDELMNSDEAFMSDASATIVGALAGTSTTTTYIESAAGVEEGGKTGLTAVVVGILMLSGLFLSGLFAAIPTFAAACALVVIGAMMMRQAADVNWGDYEIAIPAFITMVLMPFTYSIAQGIAWGVITYVVIKVGTGKHEQLNPVMWTLGFILAMFYIGPGDGNTFEWLLGLIF